MTQTRVANVIGVGLIGGSVALALGERGWRVHGDDTRDAVVERALHQGVIAERGLARHAELTVVATPVLSAPEQVRRALDETDGLVTDVCSVKGPLCAEIDDPRFVGGHPMAGSEQSGLDGAHSSLFQGAVWVLTPRADADDVSFAAVTGIVRSLGAEVVALSPEQHDRLVAVVSHVPHLAAASLVRLAAERSVEHAALLRLAAGGFRDMTRIASGLPEMWIDICAENRVAIVGALGQLIAELDRLRDVVDRDDRAALLDQLVQAREARTNLPGRIGHPEEIAELRVPIPDRPGAAAELFTLAAELDVNIADFEVVHSAEGQRGVAVVLVDRGVTDLFRGGLIARGFRPSVVNLS